jgi:hypothetical protein
MSDLDQLTKIWQQFLDGEINSTEMLYLMAKVIHPESFIEN